MYHETKPIILDCPKQFDRIEIYPIHDLHYGNECYDAHKYNVLRDYILDKPYRFVAFVGDLMENAVPGSKSDPLTQRYTPLEQREFVTEQFKAFKGRIICVVDGNHELNRSTRMAGLYPLYDAACIAGVEDLYRSAYAVVDVGVGKGAAGHTDRPNRYIGFVSHRAKDLKSFASVDQLDGFDFMLYGHDHDPREHARAKLCYDVQKRAVTRRSVEMINSGSFLAYGGYGAAAGYRPQSDKMYKLVLYGSRHKRIETVGFYPDQL